MLQVIPAFPFAGDRPQKFLASGAVDIAEFENMQFDFNVYEAMVARSAANVFVMYLLSYWLLSCWLISPKIIEPWTWSWRILGFGVALLVAPFVLTWEAGTIAALVEESNASETGFITFFRVGFISSVIGIVATEVVRSFGAVKKNDVAISGCAQPFEPTFPTSQCGAGQNSYRRAMEKSVAIRKAYEKRYKENLTKRSE